MSMINLRNIEWQTFANNILDLLFYLKCIFSLITDHDNFSNGTSRGSEKKKDLKLQHHLNSLKLKELFQAAFPF